MQGEVVTPLPHGPHKLLREEVLENQRERILAAVVCEVGSRGYANTTISQITARAHVSRDSFYEQFAGKKDCFLAAYDRITQTLLDDLITVGNSQSSWIEGVRRAAQTIVRFWCEHPNMVRFWMFEVFALGSDGLRHRARALHRFERLLEAAAERAKSEQQGLPEVPSIIHHATVVSTLEFVSQWILADGASDPFDLEEALLYLWLMDIAGHEVAATALGSTDNDLVVQNAVGERQKSPDARQRAIRNSG
jgi:AcrR family transcriptional regulator